jgi:hypothetical protein
MLLVEIGMLAAAWKRGWKGWALLPLLIGLGLGFLMGLSSAEDAQGVGLLVDVGVIIALGIMIAMPRAKEDPKQVSAQATWTCSQCGSGNTMFDKKCSHCGTPKPMQASTVESVTSVRPNN